MAKRVTFDAATPDESPTSNIIPLPIQTTG